MESASQPQQPDFTPEQKQLALKYQQFDQEYKAMIQKVLEIEEEKREHSLVLETLQDLPEDK